MYISDITPPVITGCPAGNVINANLPAGSSTVAVSWTITATDNVALAAGTPTVSSTPAGYVSGSLFPRGSVSMSLVFRDTSTNAATCSFTVNVAGKFVIFQ